MWAEPLFFMVLGMILTFVFVISLIMICCLWVRRTEREYSGYSVRGGYQPTKGVKDSRPPSGFEASKIKVYAEGRKW